MKKIMMLLLCLLLLTGCDINLGGNGNENENENEDTKGPDCIIGPAVPTLTDLKNEYTLKALDRVDLDVSFKKETFYKLVGDYGFDPVKNEWFSIRNYSTIKQENCVEVKLGEVSLYKFDKKDKLYDAFGQETIVKIDDINNIKYDTLDLFVSMNSNFYERITGVKSSSINIVHLKVLSINNTYYAVMMANDNAIIMQNIFNKKDAEGFLPSCVKASNVDFLTLTKYQMTIDDKTYIACYKENVFGNCVIEEHEIYKTDASVVITLDFPQTSTYFEYAYDTKEVSNITDATYTVDNKFYCSSIYHNGLKKDINIDYVPVEEFYSVNQTYAFILAKKILPDKSLSNDYYYLSVNCDGNTSKLLNDKEGVNLLQNLNFTVETKNKLVPIKKNETVLTFNKDYLIKEVDNKYFITSDYTNYLDLNITGLTYVMNNNSVNGDILLRNENTIFVINIKALKQNKLEVMKVNYNKILIEDLCVFINDGMIYYEGAILSYNTNNYNVSYKQVLGKTYTSLVVMENETKGESFVFLDRNTKEIL